MSVCKKITTKKTNIKSIVIQNGYAVASKNVGRKITAPQQTNEHSYYNSIHFIIIKQLHQFFPAIIFLLEQDVLCECVIKCESKNYLQ